MKEIKYKILFCVCEKELLWLILFITFQVPRRQKVTVPEFCERDLKWMPARRRRWLCWSCKNFVYQSSRIFLMETSRKTLTRSRCAMVKADIPYHVSNIAMYIYSFSRPIISINHSTLHPDPEFCQSRIRDPGGQKSPGSRIRHTGKGLFILVKK